MTHEVKYHNTHTHTNAHTHTHTYPQAYTDTQHTCTYTNQYLKLNSHYAGFWVSTSKGNVCVFQSPVKNKSDQTFS